jgi:hypothetical protein
MLNIRRLLRDERSLSGTWFVENCLRSEYVILDKINDKPARRVQEYNESHSIGSSGGSRIF